MQTPMAGSPPEPETQSTRLASEQKDEENAGKRDSHHYQGHGGDPRIRCGGPQVVEHCTHDLSACGANEQGRPKLVGQNHKDDHGADDNVGSGQWDEYRNSSSK